MLNQLIIKTMPLIPKSIIHAVAKRYIAGDELTDAVRVTKDFAKLGGMTTIDVLGEFVETKERALHEQEGKREVLAVFFDPAAGVDHIQTEAGGNKRSDQRIVFISPNDIRIMG